MNNFCRGPISKSGPILGSWVAVDFEGLSLIHCPPYLVMLCHLLLFSLKLTHSFVKSQVSSSSGLCSPSVPCSSLKCSSLARWAHLGWPKRLRPGGKDLGLLHIGGAGQWPFPDPQTCMAARMASKATASGFT